MTAPEAAAGYEPEYPELPKACDFLDAADAANWDTWWDENSGEGTTYARAERNAEIIEINWQGNRIESVLYSHDGAEFRNLRNVADARARLIGEPLPPPAARGRPAAPKTEDDGSDPFKIRILPRVWPLDFYQSDDDEILDAIRGRTLVWWNKWKLGYDRAEVHPPRQRSIRVEERPDGRMILHFVSPEGFRAVAISTLAQVI